MCIRDRPLGTQPLDVVGEYSFGDAGEPTLTLRSRCRVENRCAAPLRIKVAGAGFDRDLGVVGERASLPLDVLAAAPPDALVYARLERDGADAFAPACALRDLLGASRAPAPLRRADGPRRRGGDGALRAFVGGGADGSRLVLAPPRVLASRLAARCRVATAVRWPQSREDYAATYDVPAGGTSDVHRGDARFWCLRVDGYEGQSDWVDVSGVLYGLQGDDDATASATLTVGEEGGRRLRLTLRRAKRPPAGLFEDDAEISQTLELCCAAVVVDRTGLGLGVSHRDRVARPSPRSAVGGHPAVMVDASPHGGVVLEHVARVLLGHARQGRGRALARARRDHGKMPRAAAVAIDRRRLQVFLDGREYLAELRLLRDSQPCQSSFLGLLTSVECFSESG